MNEHEFLQKLEQRAKEEESLIQQNPTTSLYYIISIWLGEQPWRILIPLAFIITLLLYFILGNTYINFILWIFGGL